MESLTKREKNIRISYNWVIFVASVVLLFIIFFAAFSGGFNRKYYVIEINGVRAGMVKNKETAQKLMNNARKELGKESDSLVLVDIHVNVREKRRLFGGRESEEKIEQRIYQVMSDHIIKQRERAYTVKINEFTVNLRSSQEVLELLKAAKNKYDVDNQFDVELVLDPTRELNVLTTKVVNIEEREAKEAAAVMKSAGVGGAVAFIEEEIEVVSTPEDYDLGLQSLDFGDTVEVVEAYVEEGQVTTLADAILLVTKEQEKNKIYEVAAGDTLSQIAEKNETTIDKIVSLNENIENKDSVIRAGDEIIVTVPEPELTVVRKEEIYYEENYNAQVQYIDNDSWYTTETVVKQEPIAGFRKVVAQVNYRNEEAVEKEIIYEDVTVEAVPKVVERGTKVPPSYIKPLSGGRFTSGFKMRWGRMHKGVDWACPIGTAIKASSSGTVTKAGWGSGYGYVVYINHDDGRQTRYGHLSKILVKAGQRVNQGDKIALSGNTGRSTGPHVHFEILINGSQVNPLDYMN